MPYSDVRPRPWVLNELRERNILSGIGQVTDVGAGAGGWLDFLKPHIPESHWTAVEIWEPYIPQFRLKERYNEVLNADARTLRPFPAADLTIFGDVLEHMIPADAQSTWEAARQASYWVVASLPIFIRYEQGALEGNPYETHLHHWDMESFTSSFSGIVSVSPQIDGTCAGAFIARGVRE